MWWSQGQAVALVVPRPESSGARGGVITLLAVPPASHLAVIADSIGYAAGHQRRRERCAGSTTAAMVLSGKVTAGLPGRYLARARYSSGRASPDRPANWRQPGAAMVPEQPKAFASVAGRAA
jgi:hypothetical protein